MRIRSLLAALLLLPALALAQEPPKTDPKTDPKPSDDPIAAELLKDKEAYAASYEKAKTDLLKNFDKQSEAIKKDTAAWQKVIKEANIQPE